MPVTVTPLPLDKKNMRRFVQFGVDLYRNNPYFVPPLIGEEIESLLPHKNPAFDYCEAQPFMAYDSETRKPLGRILAIINHAVNNRSGRKEARFGMVDFIDSNEVVDALFNAAHQWAREKGMTEIIGPMGFTDMDHEGMLVDGFDQPGTMATIYNFPYYPSQIERIGYKKDTDWVEYRVTVVDSIPEKFNRIADIVARKYQLRKVTCTSRSTLKKRYGQALFDLINEAYDKLYGYSPLTQRQIDYYISKYLGIIRLDCLSIIVDANDNLVALGIAMPSLTKALQRSRGRIFPFGWIHLLRGLYGSNPVVDLMLIAVKAEYLSRGVNALIFQQLIPAFNKIGFKEAESNLELESNEAVRAQWQYFPNRLHRRRRAYRLPL